MFEELGEFVHVMEVDITSENVLSINILCRNPFFYVFRHDGSEKDSALRGNFSGPF